MRSPRSPPIYIFGAGTSKCAGAPLMHEFAPAAFRRANVAITTSDYRKDPKYVEAYEPLVSAANRWRELSPNADVEAHYVLIEMLNNLERTGESQGRLYDLQYLIAETLRMEIGEGLSPNHVNFVSLLWTKFSGQPKPRIITLNWDVVLETAVRNNTHIAGHPVIDYGLGRMNCTFHAPLGAEEKDRLRIYKLHGSLNWTVCGKCGVSATESKTDQAASGPSVHCPTCMDNARRLFVPPSSQKLTGQVQQIADLWKAARLELQACRELAIVGYSLPRTDVQFQMFLTEALAQNKQLERICVVSEPKFGATRAAWEDHYSSVFRGGPHHHKLSFRYLRFEDWVTDECRLYEAARWG